MSNNGLETSNEPQEGVCEWHHEPTMKLGYRTPICERVISNLFRSPSTDWWMSSNKPQKQPLHKPILTSIRHSHVALRTQTHVRALHVPAYPGAADVGSRALVHVLAALLVRRQLPAVAARAHERAERVRARAVLAQRRVLRALVDVGKCDYV